MATPHPLRRSFVAGLLILLPIYVTYLLIAFLMGMLAGVGAPVLAAILSVLGPEHPSWIDPLVPAVNVLVSFGIVVGVGLVGSNLVGRRVLEAFDTLMLRLPLVKSFYSATKQIVDTFQGPGGSFQRVVMVQYPSKGLWVMGFVAGEHRDRLHLSPTDSLLAVFIPTTPNPTSGYLVLVPPTDVVDVSYTVEEAFKFIVSSGIVGKELAPRASEPSAQPA